MLNGISLGIILTLVLLVGGFLLSLLINAFLVPLFKTPTSVLEEILQLMELEKKDTLVDLGSGDGHLLFKAYEQSQCKCIGYDISPISMIIARTKKLLYFPFVKEIVLEPQDIFKVPLENATKIYCYLDEKSLNVLSPKFNKFLNSGGTVYSYHYNIPNLKNERKVVLKNEKPLYIYSTSVEQDRI